eukprot:4065924-Prymnesium_polylepis.1
MGVHPPAKKTRNKATKPHKPKKLQKPQKPYESHTPHKANEAGDDAPHANHPRGREQQRHPAHIRLRAAREERHQERRAVKHPEAHSGCGNSQWVRGLVSV